jgi:NAD(P)-dependent dehydrogenase (short-subunit alcohol dehydrogenase family)
MQVSLQNEVVVVTGGAKRLGRAIALECAASGASVAITFNASQNEAEKTLADLRAASASNRSNPGRSNPGGGASATQRFAALSCELSDSKQIYALQNRVLEAIGRPTALVNNAAIFRRTPFAPTEYSQWEAAFDEHIAANLKAPYLLSKVFGDLFLEHKRGAIVNLADIYGARPLANYTPYCISKAGVLMLTQTLAKALAPHVRVNAICPGTILPPSQTQNENDEVAELVARVPLQRLGTPQEIAQTVVFLIGGPQFISGAMLPLDGAQILR